MKPLFALAAFTLSLSLFASTMTLEGKTDGGQECKLKISSPKKNDPDNVLMRAKISGKGIPFKLGGLTTKLHVFQMVQIIKDDGDLGHYSSLASEGDPVLEIHEDGRLVPSLYKLTKGGLDNEIETVTCKNLKYVAH